MSTRHPLRIGTRGSQLALVQTQWVVEALTTRDPTLPVEIVVIRTKGDVITDRPLREVAGKGFFVKEIESALLAGAIDCAVHSLKDLPTELPDGLTLAALCNRIEPRDALVVRGMAGTYDWQTVVAQLPVGARVGTSSLRRQAQLKYAFPHWQLLELRGNVDTRLRKLDAGQYDAIVVAAAGLLRLGLHERINCLLPPELCCPAAGQGVLAVESRAGDAATLELLASLDEPQLRAEVAAERAAMHALGAGCHTAVGAWAQVQGHQLLLWVAVAAPDGSHVWRHYATTALPDDPQQWNAVAHALGVAAAHALLTQGATTVR
ncbi:Porphobilinogen deaminase [bacterium HR17]|jgi:hydroxymethylbilane synthase|uniref:Porphobilinogen deaminase n=1 Tax=Candidatus Fervidibacter japonicus TaxID=2035412 RepID=A0A2H5XCZ2_9BACT|nr:Porphobilinogen deaminase [bacterium HR17]